MRPRGRERRREVLRVEVSRSGEGKGLEELCLLYGVVARYAGSAGGPVRSGRESLLAVLRGLGAPLPPGRDPSEGDLRGAARSRRMELAARVLPRIVVAWDGRLPALRARLPEALARVELRLRVEVEEEPWLERPIGPPFREHRIEARRFAVRPVGPPAAPERVLPPGMHELSVGAAGGGPALARATVVSAPRRLWTDPGGEPGWGVFLPLYALRSGRTSGVGDYGELARLGAWAAGSGASHLGTLPLLPLFLGEPFDPSPYAPVSRLFWSELYLDLGDVVSRTDSEAGRAYLASRTAGTLRRTAEAADEVEYRTAGALRRELLDRIVEEAGAGEALAGRWPGLAAFRERRPEAESFARFMAACELRRRPWPAWEPEARDAPARGTELHPGRDFDPAARDRHLVAQWLAAEQVAAVAGRGECQGFGLYLDLPLSAHRAGFDVWRERGRFATGMSVGAPPDAFFDDGQDWGFPPPLPHAMRAAVYSYWRASLEHSMRHASVLRVDHVMGLHRLFWIPEGAQPTEGVYVRYAARELYAVLSLVSHRSRTEVVGEDLGTVPCAVRRAMDAHGAARLFVVPFEIDPDAVQGPPLHDPPAGSVAALDTHDTWPFAGWWRAADIEGRLELGMLAPDRAAAERERRTREREALVGELVARGLLAGEERAEPGAVLRACLEALGESPAGTVLVNLEDLWLETRPQNVPGAPGAAGSWRRRARLRLEELGRPGTVAALRRLEAARRRAGSETHATREGASPAEGSDR